MKVGGAIAAGARLIKRRARAQRHQRRARDADESWRGDLAAGRRRRRAFRSPSPLSIAARQRWLASVFFVVSADQRARKASDVANPISRGAVAAAYS